MWVSFCFVLEVLLCVLLLSVPLPDLRKKFEKDRLLLFYVLHTCKGNLSIQTIEKENMVWEKRNIETIEFWGLSKLSEI